MEHSIRLAIGFDSIQLLHDIFTTMRGEKTIMGWLWTLRIFILLNFAYFIFLITSSDTALKLISWKIYIFTDTTLILSYLWYCYIKTFWAELRPKQYAPLLNTGYTVLVPCYNEEPHLLEEAVKSIVNQRNNYKKQIILIDDGSKNNIYSVMEKLQVMYPFADVDISIHKFEENRGKRFAHEIGIKHAKHEFIISVDSDTILNKNAISELLKPFSDPKIGATTGNVFIKNETQNYLTRIQTGIYWIGLSIQKRAQSLFGDVICCSGCLSAYRKEDLLKVMDDYVNQQFLGHSCKASKDRHLTNLLSEMGKNIVFVPESFCHTEVPHTFKKYIAQQRRWKMGFYREALYTTTYSWKTSKVLYFENLIWMLFSPLFNLTSILVTTYLLLLYPSAFLAGILPILILISIARDSLFFVNHPIKGILYLPYVIFYAWIIYPLNIITLFQSSPEKWGTR